MLLIPHESNTVNSEMAEFEMTGVTFFYITKEIKIFESDIHYFLRFAVLNSFSII